MTRLQPIDVEQRMTELLARKLSPTTVRYARGVLRRALNDGMREAFSTATLRPSHDRPSGSP